MTEPSGRSRTDDSLWPEAVVSHRTLHGVRFDDGEVRLVERTEELARQFVRQHGVGTYVRAIETTTVTRTPWEDE